VAPRALTLEQWLDLGEDEPGELCAGRLQEEEVPDFVHELTVSWLLFVIRSWLGGRGFVIGSELKIVLPGDRGRKADLVVILPGTRAPARSGPLREPPDILVEVITPTPRDERRDRVEKMEEYAQFGVPYYWLVDPALGAFEIFGRTAAGNYEKLIGTTSGVVDDVPGCTGLRIDVDALWAELARLDQR
jgi:Uma2 family endonuclease